MRIPTMLLVEFYTSLFSIICMLIKLTGGSILFSVSDDVSTWNKANSSCNLATPKLQGLGMDKTPIFDHNIEMIEGEEAWIGYLSERAVLEYIGCVEYTSSVGSLFSPPVITDTDLGQCSIVCSNTTYFGVKLTECYCFNELPPTNDIHETRCTKKCSHPKDGAACGGGKFVSMYTHANIAYNNLTTQMFELNRGDCVLYDQNKRQYLPTKCTMAYQSQCQSSTGKLYTRIFSAKRWLDMTINCFGFSLFPSTYDVTQGTSGYRQFWTGMVTTSKIFTNIKDSRDTVFGVYVLREDGKYKLRYSSKTDTEDRRYICQYEATAPPVTTTTTTTTKPNGTQSTTERTQPLIQRSDDGDDLLVVYIVVPIVILCAVIFIIIVFIWLRKRGKKGRLDIVNNGHRNAHVDAEFSDLDDTIILEHVEEHHEDVDYSNVPTLRVSDREYNNSTLQRQDHSGGIDGPMDSEEQYEYSTIKKERQDERNKKQESFDPTYDTTKAPNKPKNGSVMNSTYDTADFDEPYDEQYKNIGHITNQQDTTSDKITEGLSGF